LIGNNEKFLPFNTSIIFFIEKFKILYPWFPHKIQVLPLSTFFSTIPFQITKERNEKQMKILCGKLKIYMRLSCYDANKKKIVEGKTKKPKL
jgi:hypothetical protein